MSIVGKIKRAIRGEVGAKSAALEVLRRGQATISRSRERERIEEISNQPPRLSPQFAGMSPTDLLAHFRSRSSPSFFPGFSAAIGSANSYRQLFPGETDQLLANAEQIANDHSWSILGLGRQSFGFPVEWQRDPVSGNYWPLDYHAEVNLTRDDGSDVRMLWELNRLSHFITLARAYAVSGDERFSGEFLEHFAFWQLQNPFGYGANWNCAMEVALRAMNLLGAFEIFRRSTKLAEQDLETILAEFDRHGHFIRDHLEFSYVATSNHYLSDVAGLLWLGIMLPELDAAAAWREFGLREMLQEMDKQVLADGADFESSTGYHRFVLELFLYSFILCRANAIAIEQKYWDKLRAMLNYLQSYLRPDGRAPLIGDSDGGQVFPIRFRDANDHAYVLAVGATFLGDAALASRNYSVPEELVWILGDGAVAEYQKLKTSSGATKSTSFPHAGVHVLTEDDLYLSFNTTDAGIHGRGSHGHNDALSIEVSACGTSFIVDPGTYVYTANHEERHLFRSTAYHSSLEIDGEEQNTIDRKIPFVIGNEAKPSLLSWQSDDRMDRVSAEHYGYRRLSQPVTHRRTITFNKQQRWWLIEDELDGAGEHEIVIRFHLNSGLDVGSHSAGKVWVKDLKNGAGLLIGPLDIEQSPELESQFTSVNYLEKTPSTTIRWALHRETPCKFRWALIPVCGTLGELEADLDRRLDQVHRFRVT
jgi:Heparinase II/III-like protein/Heparinase II/III N-terminus